MSDCVALYHRLVRRILLRTSETTADEQGRGDTKPMTLRIRERSGGTRPLRAADVEGALDEEPRQYEGEPTEWKQYLSARHRAELEQALLELLRFFVARIAAEEGKSAATLRLADAEHRVIVQGRNSAADEGRGSSVRAQMYLAAKKLVAENCWPVAVWYEYHQSAFLKWSKPRRWFNQKFELVELGKAPATIIMATFSSRFTRRLSEMTTWLDVLERQDIDMRLICASQSGHHFDTPLEDVYEWWVDQAKISQGESAAKSKMIRNKQCEMLADGRVTRGYGRCYGYEPLTDPKLLNRRGKPTQVGARLVRTRPADGSRSEAEWLERAFELRLAGLSWSAVARQCYREGCRSRSRTLIRAGKWKKLLTAPRMIGCERKDGELFRVEIEQLVSDEQYERLMAIEGLDPATGAKIVHTPRESNRSYPLSGLLQCCCGAPMIHCTKRLKDGSVRRRYQCSRRTRLQENAEGKSWTSESAMDGKQHTGISAELAEAFLRELCADALANLEDSYWDAADATHLRVKKPSVEIEQIEQEIAELDDCAALLNIQIANQRRPGYRGERLAPAEAKQQSEAYATRRAALVNNKVRLEETDTPAQSLFPRGTDVRAEIRNCTDDELHLYVKQIFDRLWVRRAELSSIAPERRIEGKLAREFCISDEIVERLLEQADTARFMRWSAAQKKKRDIAELEDDAERLALMHLNYTEITRKLNELGYRTSRGTELSPAWVARLVPRLMSERHGLTWISPWFKRGLPDELLTRAQRMHDGGATWQEVSDAFGVSLDRIRGACFKRRKRNEPSSVRLPSRLNRSVEVLCWEMRRLEGASWGEIAREMMRLSHKTPLGRETWHPTTAKHVVEQFERRDPEWCAARLAKHEAMQEAKSEAA